MAIAHVDTLACVAGKTKRVPKQAFEAFARALTKWVNEAHDGNQTAAGHALGISQGHISAMMRGDRGPGLNTILLLREKTGMSADELLGFGPPDVDALTARLQASFGLEVARFRAEASRTLEEARVVAAKNQPVREVVKRRGVKR